jgi:predicted TIM-barrel fold metal-dependent hydrolase
MAGQGEGESVTENLRGIAGESSPLIGRNSFREEKVVDIRVHLLATGDNEGGCRMSEEFMTSGRVAPALRACGIGGHVSGYEVRDSLLDALNTSEHIDYAVFLAADGVYRNDRFVAKESHLVVPNDYVMDIARENRRVLFGASVHPYRGVKEMMAETTRCINGGAVLFSWLPSMQRIDPEDSRCIPFYIRIAQEGIPLLCHTGQPFAAMTSENANVHYNDPRKLRRALDIGVKVIISHFGSVLGGETHTACNAYEDALGEMLGSAHRNGWDLYAEISTPHVSAGKAYYERLREEISRGNMSTSRLLFGSGIPLEAHDTGAPQGENLFDRHYRLLRDAGVPLSVVTHAGNILRIGLPRERIAAVQA